MAIGFILKVKVLDMKSWLLTNRSASSTYKISLETVYSSCYFTIWASKWPAVMLFQERKSLPEVAIKPPSCKAAPPTGAVSGHVALWPPKLSYGGLWAFVKPEACIFFSALSLNMRDYFLIWGIHLFSGLSCPMHSLCHKWESSSFDLKSSTAHWEQWVSFSFEPPHFQYLLTWLIHPDFCRRKCLGEVVGIWKLWQRILWLTCWWSCWQ